MNYSWLKTQHKISKSTCGLTSSLRQPVGANLKESHWNGEVPHSAAQLQMSTPKTKRLHGFFVMFKLYKTSFWNRSMNKRALAKEVASERGLYCGWLSATKRCHMKPWRSPRMLYLYMDKIYNILKWKSWSGQ